MLSRSSEPHDLHDWCCSIVAVFVPSAHGLQRVPALRSKKVQHGSPRNRGQHAYNIAALIVQHTKALDSTIQGAVRDLCYWSKAAVAALKQAVMRVTTMESRKSVQEYSAATRFTQVECDGAQLFSASCLLGGANCQFDGHTENNAQSVTLLIKLV